MGDSVHSENLGERTVELRLPSRLGYERIAMDAATSIARRMGFSAARIESLRTAIGEAVTNAIEHGNALDATSRVVVILAIEDQSLVVSVADQGHKHLDATRITHDPQIADVLKSPEKGGWGMWLIRELVDQVEITQRAGGGNQVRMVIHLEQSPDC